MLRGFRTFVCKDCGHEFVAPDIEWQATAASQPMKCPKCGSMNTHPGGSTWKTIKFFLRMLKGKPL